MVHGYNSSRRFPCKGNIMSSSKGSILVILEPTLGIGGRKGTWHPGCDPQSSPKSRSPSRGTLRFSGTPSSEPFLPSWSGQEGRLPCSQTTVLPFCISFSWGWPGSLPPVQCHEALSIVLQALCVSDLIPWIYLSLPLYNCKGFGLGHTWMV